MITPNEFVCCVCALMVKDRSAKEVLQSLSYMFLQLFLKCYQHALKKSCIVKQFKMTNNKIGKRMTV